MEVIGIDLYNQSFTNLVAKTLNSIASDADHIPCVLMVVEDDTDAKADI